MAESLSQKKGVLFLIAYLYSSSSRSTTYCISNFIPTQYVSNLALSQKENEFAPKTIVVSGANFSYCCFETIHNYIDMEHMILRKGSVSARKGERLLIPINMRDGALICVGKGNPDWNESAPHGAGRLMSRTDARSSISMKAYKDAMKGIYTTCVNKGTLDESPFAYKPMDEIVTNIEPTAEIVSKIKPIYNFKAGDEE